MPSCSSRRRASAGPGNLVFTGVEDDPANSGDAPARLRRAGAVAALVRGWHHGRLRATRSQRAREILTELVPELLRIFGRHRHPDTALLRFDQFLSRLPAGVQLFSLFHANPGLLELVAEIMAGAPLLAEQLAQRPQLLDAVLTEGFFAPPPGRMRLAADLAHAARRGKQLRGHARRGAALGRRAAVPDRRSAVASCARRKAGGRGPRRHRRNGAGSLAPGGGGEFARRHGRVSRAARLR